jgi:hypothetical protein
LVNGSQAYELRRYAKTFESDSTIFASSRSTAICPLPQSRSIPEPD